MRLSALLASVKAFDRANAIVNTPKDFDVHEHLSDVANQRDAEGRALIAGLASRAYATGDVNTPRLSGFAVDYQDGTNFVADLCAPIVKGNNARRYTKFTKRDGHRILNLEVSAKGTPFEASIDIGSGTYTEKLYAEIQKIAKKDLADAEDIPSLLAAHARALMGDMKRMREKIVADKFMTSANYASGCTTALSSTNRWDVGPATSTADPIKDIRVTMMNATALAGSPNAAVCSKKVAEYLRTHPSVIAAAGTRASDRVLSYEELRSLLDLQYFFVGDLKHDSAGSAATATYTPTWGTGFVVFHVQPGASDTDPSFAKTFEHLPLNFLQEDDNLPGSRGVTILKGACEFATEVVASDRAYLLDTVIS